MDNLKTAKLNEHNEYCYNTSKKNSQNNRNKNIKNFNGKKQLHIGLYFTKKSKLFKDIYVSTDSKKLQI